MWLCPACGGEYTQKISDMPADSIGQDLNFNYVVFMQIEVMGGSQTMCAVAAAPWEYLNNLLTTLRLILAGAKHKIRPGAQVGIIDFMTVLGKNVHRCGILRVNGWAAVSGIFGDQRI